MLMVKPWILWQENAAQSKRREEQGGDYELGAIGKNSINNYEVFKDEKVTLLAEHRRPWAY